MTSSCLSDEIHLNKILLLKQKLLVLEIEFSLYLT